MNRDEFGRLFDANLSPWPDSANRNLKAGYYESLKDIRSENLASALTWIGKNWQRQQGMPTPGDIRSRAEAIARESINTGNTAISSKAQAILSGGIRKALESDFWHPTTENERDGADKFREILAAHYGVRFCGRDDRGKLVNTWPKIDGAYLRAFNEFGGREALRLVDESCVMLARETYAKSYSKHAASENP